MAVYAFFLKNLGAAEFAVFCAAFTLVSVFVCAKAQTAFGGGDPQKIVIDEAAGFFAAMLLSSGGAGEIVLGFVLFRVFDIVKVYPSRLIEKLPGGWGIVLDDVYAGFLAAPAVAAAGYFGVFSGAFLG